MMNRNFRAFALLGIALFTASSAFAAAAERVEVCHIPPGAADEPQTITVAEPAVAAHLSHGDILGACDDLCFGDPGACDDGDECTFDQCAGGQCSSEPLAPDACDDSEPTTADRCEPATGCVNECVGQPVEPCGFDSGQFFVEEPDPSTCVAWPSVQISIKFEADILDPDDIDDHPATLEAIKPVLVAELQTLFANFTPSLTLECVDIAMDPDTALSWLGQLFSVDLLVAVAQDALPPGATEATAVSKIQSEYANDPTLMDGFEDVLTATLGVTVGYVTVNVY